MTEEIEGLFWFCQMSTKVVKSKLEKEEKSVESYTNKKEEYCIGCKKGAIIKINQSINETSKLIEKEGMVKKMECMLSDEIKMRAKIEKEKRDIEEKVKRLMMDCKGYKEKLEESLAVLAESKRTVGIQWTLIEDLRRLNKETVIDENWKWENQEKESNQEEDERETNTSNESDDTCRKFFTTQL